MPSDDSLLSRLSGARPGIAPKVIRAFPAARRQLRRRASALRGRRNIELLTGERSLHGVFTGETVSGARCNPCRSGPTAMDGA